MIASSETTIRDREVRPQLSQRLKLSGNMRTSTKNDSQVSVQATDPPHSVVLADCNETVLVANVTLAYVTRTVGYA